MAEDHRYRSPLSVVVVCSPPQRICASIYGWLEELGASVAVLAVHASLGEFIQSDHHSAGRRIDLVVVAQTFDDDGDVEALSRICAAGYRVVCFGTSLSDAAVLGCLGAGVDAFVVGDRHPAGYAAVTIRSAAELKMSTTGVTLPGLTHRESQVLIAWCHASTKEDVAERLDIERATVSSHLQRIRAKYAAVGRAASTKAALIARAVQDGLVDVYEL
ncbi:helix-turn-helix transcriptional regulator [Mycolicibacterium cosmeticum]|uniref:helix-turn-helix transcriptional regulator n=1 Tax=Mycolicibacterium cosmeticum TaxID=258533 RepID=UPI00320480D7